MRIYYFWISLTATMSYCHKKIFWQLKKSIDKNFMRARVLVKFCVSFFSKINSRVIWNCFLIWHFVPRARLCRLGAYTGLFFYYLQSEPTWWLKKCMVSKRPAWAWTTGSRCSRPQPRTASCRGPGGAPASTHISIRIWTITIATSCIRSPGVWRWKSKRYVLWRFQFKFDFRQHLFSK